METKELSGAEREAMEAAMLTMDRDGRPGVWSRLAFEAGWNAARTYYAPSADEANALRDRLGLSDA